jgi:hypothetical protein
MNDDLKRKEEMLDLLGRTDTVKNVEAAYEQILHSDRLKAIRARQQRINDEHAQTNLELYLEDLRTITGLQLNDKLFWRIFFKAINLDMRDKRLARIRQAMGDFKSPLEEGAWGDELSHGFKEHPF